MPDGAIWENLTLKRRGPESYCVSHPKSHCAMIAAPSRSMRQGRVTGVVRRSESFRDMASPSTPKTHLHSQRFPWLHKEGDHATMGNALMN